MADEPDDTLTIDPPEGVDPPDPDIDPNAPPSEGEDEGEEVVFGDEAPPAADNDNATIRHLREKLKEANQRASAAPAPAAIEVGEEPSLEAHGWDEVKWKADWLAWNDRKAQAEQQQAKAGEGGEQFRQEWQRDHQSYQAKRADLKFADVEEVESVALATLSPAQQVALVQACKNPALVLYALGKYPAKLAEIAPIGNLIKFGVAAAELEKTMAMRSRSKAPNPEEIAAGTASIAARSTSAAEKKLASMEAAWEKARGNGDRTEIQKFKRANNLR